MIQDCINTFGFIFENIRIIIKKDYDICRNRCNDCNIFHRNKHHHINDLNKLNNLIECIKKKCFNSDKICIVKLSKHNLVSSSFGLSINKNDVWENFKNNIIKFLYKYMIMTVRKNDYIFSLLIRIIKIDFCGCCDKIILELKYNIFPYIIEDDNICVQCYLGDCNKNCTNNLKHFNYKYCLKTTYYNYIRFYY